MNPDDTNRLFWEIVDASYTSLQYDLLIRRCRDLEHEVEKQKAEVEA